MNNLTAQKIVEIQEALLADEEYDCLRQEYDLHNRRFLHLLEQLPQQQRRILEDYLGVCAELHLKMLEYACTDSEVLDTVGGDNSRKTVKK